MFLYMVAELSSLKQVIEALTGLDGLPVIIVEVVVTSIYTGIADLPKYGLTSIDILFSFGWVPGVLHYR
jgi:hypothetical protein